MISRIELDQMQSLPLRLKIIKTVARIGEWYDAHDGMIYVSFSGGIDSTVLADITRRLYPVVPLVFANTGNELPEILSFVNTFSNVVQVRPKHGMRWVFETHGYPVVNKSVSKSLSRYRTAKDDVQRELRKWGGINPTSGKVQRMGVIPKRWHFLIDAPFKISDKCCEYLKKGPMDRYDRDSGRSAMTGEMAADSNDRRVAYLQRGCNYFGTHHKSTPMGFWTRQDVLEYLVEFKIPYCNLYGDIIRDNTAGLLETTGEQRTGCWCCFFGCHMEPHPNRFERMKITHPKHYDVCINKLGGGKVLDFMGVVY